MKTLRGRLLVPLMAATLALWSVAGIVSYTMALHEAGEMLDGQLSQSARMILAHIGDDGVDSRMLERLDRVLDRKTGHPYEQPVEFVVRQAGGPILYRSSDAPALEDIAGSGYSDFERDGAPWRGFATLDPTGRIEARVAQRTLDRDHAAIEVAVQVAIPIFVAIPLLTLILLLVVRRALHPVQAIASDVAARTTDELSALSEPDAPEEVRPLIDALNGLLSRVRTALDNERRFTSDAAHGLRTPLAALRVHAQVAAASGPGAAQREALDRVIQSVDRATRLVDQMLRLARLDPLRGVPNPQPVRLADVARDVCAEVAPLAAGRNQEVRMAPMDPDARVPGDPEMLRLCVRCLAENALRYSPPHKPIDVALSVEGTGLRLSVSDEGPGVPSEDLPHLAERFFRGNDAQGVEGTGLGLAIALRIAELHGARLDLANRPRGGFVAAIAWPGAG